MRQLLLTLTFLLAFISYSQNYNHVDSIVSNYPDKFRSINYFANRVAKDFDTDLDKTRAVYYWIANHIVYDYKSRRNGSNGYKSIEVTTEDDYKHKLLAMEKKYAERTLKRKLAVCEGYAQLFKFTLLELGIEAEVISGFARINPSEIGRIRNDTNHAWNAVKIQNEWKLVDATWSTDSEEEVPEQFNFRDTYFFIAPEDLILSHFPKDKKWQLLKNPLDKADYFYQPLFYETYYDSGLKLKEKTQGLIKIKSKDFIEITFDAIDPTYNYYYAFSEFSTSKKLFFEKKNGKYVTKIPFNSNRKTVLGIYHNFTAAIDFKIIPAK